MAICPGIDFTDPTVIEPYRISREEVLLKLARELLCGSVLYQKKGYKLVYLVLGYMPSSFRQEITEILEEAY